jgi:mono/diheme cytochrome c family protein
VAEVTPQRPDQIVDFNTLYSNNCAACHGTEGRQGAAISLANPAYLVYAGEQNIAQVTAQGIPGSLMPAFAREHGGLLTDAQVNIIAHGMVSNWGHPEALYGATPPPYISSAVGDSGRGEAGYRQQCLRCHAAGVGSILDPAYLALISDGGLRSIIVAGKPEQGMPDWAGYGGAPFTDGQIADLVAFLASHRVRTPGQPYPRPAQGNAPGTLDKTKPSTTPAREKVSH